MLCYYNAEYEYPTLPGPLQLSGVRVTWSLVVCIVFCWCLFVLFFHFISHSQHSINMWNGRVCDRSGLWVAMHLCVCGFVSVSMIFQLVFGAVPVVSTFFFFILWHVSIFFSTVILSYDFNWIVDLLNHYLMSTSLDKSVTS